MQRRAFLRATAVGAGSVAFAGTLWQNAALALPAQKGPGPYGALKAADANGVMLPAGFTSRVVARSRALVGSTGYAWHDAPDGGACFADGLGWIYVSNSEISTTGGASAIRFSSTGAITSAYRILANTNRNCAGGATPWNRWLSCEEIDRGYVYETNPWGGAAVQRPAMGRFMHEAAACDPIRKVIYLTEDQSDGCFYRFVPTTWGNLSSGRLQVALGLSAATAGVLVWANVPDVDGYPVRTRYQVSGVKRFNGGEGCHYANGTVWFTTKGDNRVWQVNCSTNAYELAYDNDLVVPGPAPLTGVDNITGASSGDLFVAEDGGNMEINVITPDDVVAPFVRLVGHGSSEICGPAFSPAGNRLYFSSQRGTTGSSSGGITYEVTGPFRS
ncbi:MAG TPA: alkaline phosphatase PhoX [Cryptosporangiaceae bacterium]|nr:alkaline phosphatase PhoX [Cryptosporangiaceae bacterium]